MRRDLRIDDLDVVDPFAAITPLRTHTVRVLRSDERFDKPHEKWNAFDLTAEFNSRAYQIGAGDVPHQVNSRNLGGALGRLIAQGSRPDALAKCIELFFGNHFCTRDIGSGYPLWRRFLADITSTYDRAVRTLEGNVITDDRYYAEDLVWAAASSRQLAADVEASRIDDERRAVESARKALEDAAAREARDQATAAVNAQRRAELFAWEREQEQRAAQAAQDKADSHRRLREESEARQAEHPDEEWIIEEVEWTEAAGWGDEDLLEGIVEPC